MKKKYVLCLFACMLMLTAGLASAQTNVALSATPSTSYCSSWETIDALNDGYDPTDSNDESHPQYGNWPKTGTQWVQYDWGSAQSIGSMAVYWFDDPYGIDHPSAARLYNWNGSSFVQIATVGVAIDQYNNASFSAISTSRIRLEFDSNGSQSTGILEWKVYSDGGATTAPPTTAPPTTPPPTTPPPTNPPGEEYNIAPDATSSTSYCSSWETITAINDEVEPNDSSGTNPSGIDRYGNWDQVGTEWVEYQWGASVEIHKSAVYWFDDNQGIDLPSAGRLLYWTGSSYSTFATVGTSGDQYNINDFSPLTTTRVRLEMDSNGSYSTGVLEWQIYTGEPGPTQPPTPTPPPVGEGPGPVYVSNYTVNSTLFSDRLSRLKSNWIPHLYSQCNNLNLAEGGINNFIQARRKNDGLSYSGHVGYWFSPVWVLGTFESMCLANLTGANFTSQINNWMPDLLGAQESDGYMSTWHQLGGYTRWSSSYRDAHEGYVAEYFIDAGIAHYLLTGSNTFLDAAKDLAECWINNRPGAGQWWDGHQGLKMTLTRLTRLTGDTSYTMLAKTLLDVRTGGSEYDQSHTYPRLQTSAVGHAVRAVYMYAGMADVAAILGDSTYANASDTLWNSVVNRKYYVTGGLGSGETSEGFGGDYSLRQNAYNETCAGIGNMFFNTNMMYLHADAKYIDIAETSFYNNVLGSLDLNCNNYFYTNPLESSATRYSWHVCPCCVHNIARTWLSLPRWMYAKTDSTLFVNMFIGSTINVGAVGGTNVSVTQSTNYPWDGSVTITVNPSASANFTIKIRSPQRSVSTIYSSTPDGDGITSLTVNSQSQSTATSNGYVTITRTWNAGDVIQMELPMPIQRVKAISQVTACSGRVALRRGPIVYCIESVDQSTTLTLPSYATLNAVWDGSLLNGITKITCSNPSMVAIPRYVKLNRGGSTKVWMYD